MDRGREGGREGETSRGAQGTQCDCRTTDLHFAYRLEQLFSVQEVQKTLGARGARSEGGRQSLWTQRPTSHYTADAELHCLRKSLRCYVACLNV